MLSALHPSTLYDSVPSSRISLADTKTLDWSLFNSILTAHASDATVLRSFLLYKSAADDGRNALQQALIWDIPEGPYDLLSDAILRTVGPTYYDIREDGYERRTSLHFACSYTTHEAVLIDVILHSSDLSARMHRSGRFARDVLFTGVCQHRWKPPSFRDIFEEALADRRLFAEKHGGRRRQGAPSPAAAAAIEMAAAKMRAKEAAGEKGGVLLASQRRQTNLRAAELCASCVRPCRALRVAPPCCALVHYCSSKCAAEDRARHDLFHSSSSSGRRRRVEDNVVTATVLPPIGNLEGKDGALKADTDAAAGDRFFSDVKKLYKCRKELHTRWTNISDGILERIHPLDMVELWPDQFDPNMRQVSLTGGVVQTLDSLNEVGAAALPIFKTLLVNMLVELQLPADYLFVADLKGATPQGAARCYEKALNDYSKRPDGPGLAWIFDMVRGSVVCKSQAEVERVVSHLVAKKVVVRLKNRFVDATPGGFRDFNLNIRLVVPGRAVVHTTCELTVHVKGFSDFARTVGSHEVYGLFRGYFVGGTEAVDRRLGMMDSIFGVVPPDDRDRSAAFSAARGAHPPSAPVQLSHDATLEKVIQRLCEEETDTERLEAAYELFNAMCLEKYALRIKRAQAERKRLTRA